MSSIKYVVEGGRSLSGSIEPAGNKNAALPIIAAALLTRDRVRLENVPRILDTETLVELVRSVGASATWTATNTLEIEAREVRAEQLDPVLCANIRAWRYQLRWHRRDHARGRGGLSGPQVWPNH